MESTTENENINIYVVTYNCNDMKLTGNNPSIENFVTRVINNAVPIYNHNGKTRVNINEKNIFIFGIQEAPDKLNKPYPKMLNNITTNLNTNNKYKSYYFDKTTISNTKLFIIYNVDKIDIVDEKFIDLSGRVINKFNKHALRVTIRHNKQKILTVITTHLQKGNLEPFFVNDLKKVLDATVYKNNIILFGDLNSRTLYKEPGSSRFVSYNDVNSSKITHIKDPLESLKDIPLFQLSTNNTNFINTLKHKNYYHSGENIKFSNATNTLKNPTYRYDKTKTPPELNYRKTKKKVKALGKFISIFQRGKDKVKDEDEGKFKVPSYPDRVLYKSDTKLTLINDSAHVLNYVGSDHLPVIVKFTYSVPATAAINTAAAEAPASATAPVTEAPPPEAPEPEAPAEEAETPAGEAGESEAAAAEKSEGPEVENEGVSGTTGASPAGATPSETLQSETPQTETSSLGRQNNINTFELTNPKNQLALLKSFNKNSNNIKIDNIQIDDINVLDSTFEYNIDNKTPKIKLSDLKNLDSYNLKYDQKIKLLNKFTAAVDANTKITSSVKKLNYKHVLESFLKQLKGGKKKLSKKLFIKNKKQTKKTN